MSVNRTYRNNYHYCTLFAPAAAKSALAADQEEGVHQEGQDFFTDESGPSTLQLTPFSAGNSKIFRQYKQLVLNGDDKELFAFLALFPLAIKYLLNDHTFSDERKANILDKLPEECLKHLKQIMEKNEEPIPQILTQALKKKEMEKAQLYLDVENENAEPSHEFKNCSPS